MCIYIILRKAFGLTNKSICLRATYLTYVTSRNTQTCHSFIYICPLSVNFGAEERQDVFKSGSHLIVVIEETDQAAENLVGCHK